MRRRASSEQKVHLHHKHCHSCLGNHGGGLHGPCAPSICRTGRTLSRLSNLCLVHCGSLEIPRSWPTDLATPPSTQGMGLRWCLFRDVRCGRVSCSCRRSSRRLCCGAGFHLSYVGVLVVPTRSRVAPNSAIGEPMIRAEHCVFTTREMKLEWLIYAGFDRKPS